MTIELASQATSKPKKRRRVRALPLVQDLSQMQDISLNLKCETVATSWEDIPLYTLFSVNRDGSHPKVKTSKVMCLSLTENKAYHVDSNLGSRFFRMYTI